MANIFCTSFAKNFDESNPHEIEELKRRFQEDIGKDGYLNSVEITEKEGVDSFS